jgi:NaMN:DMB phosphoribosyltransferase
LSSLGQAEIDRCPGPGMGIDDQQLVDACKVVLEATACVESLF